MGAERPRYFPGMQARREGRGQPPVSGSFVRAYAKSICHVSAGSQTHISFPKKKNAAGAGPVKGNVCTTRRKRASIGVFSFSSNPLYASNKTQGWKIPLAPGFTVAPLCLINSAQTPTPQMPHVFRMGSSLGPDLSLGFVSSPSTRISLVSNSSPWL